MSDEKKNNATICVSQASDSLEDIEMECEKAFTMWSEINRIGAVDPYHEDGYMLNMLRNEILSLQHRILRICNAKSLQKPEIAMAAPPPIMDEKYMARGAEYSEIAGSLKKELFESSIYKMYLEKKCNLSIRGNEKLQPFSWVISQLKNGIERESAIMLQRALTNGLMTVGSALPAGAGRFLEKLALILENMDEEDYNDQQTLY